MAETFSGIVEITDGADRRIILDGNDGEIRVEDADGAMLRLDGRLGNLILGGSGEDGDLSIKDNAGNTVIRLNGSSARMLMGGDGQDSELRLENASGTTTIRLQANGGANAGGGVRLDDENGKQTVYLDGDFSNLVLGNADGDAAPAGVYLHDDDGRLAIRVEGNGHIVGVKNDDDYETIHLNGRSSDVYLGGGGQDGDLFLQNVNADKTIHLDGQAANLTMGGWGSGGNIFLRNDGGHETLHIDGATGDIRFLNADCAEDFDVAEGAVAEPGTVMTLDTEARLRHSESPYDHRVAGVISGAGDYQPGIVLDRQANAAGRKPIALVGKAFCKVDAAETPIEVGDLLTTSSTPGHAMKADPGKAAGAVLGKALRPLHHGKALIPVLISLQ